jgi:hypothetical protein
VSANMERISWCCFSFWPRLQSLPRRSMTTVLAKRDCPLLIMHPQPVSEVKLP